MVHTSQLLVTVLVCPVLGGMFGPPKFVQEACKKWCDADQNDADVAEACTACSAGPQTNPGCAAEGANCGYCEEQITFSRHYPKLWLLEESFDMAKLEGKTRCWCDTGCPVYNVKSRMFCSSECTEVCNRVSGIEV